MSLKLFFPLQLESRSWPMTAHPPLPLAAVSAKMVFSLDPERKRLSLYCEHEPISIILTLIHSCHSDPLVSHGRHFGRTIHALCNVYTILTNGLLRLGELADEPDEAFTLE